MRIKKIINLFNKLLCKMYGHKILLRKKYFIKEYERSCVIVRPSHIRCIRCDALINYGMQLYEIIPHECGNLEIIPLEEFESLMRMERANEIQKKTSCD